MFAQTEESGSNPPQSFVSALDNTTPEESFDRHILGRLLLHATAEAAQLQEPVTQRLGLEKEALHRLVGFLHLEEAFPASLIDGPLSFDDEEVMIRDLLAHNLANEGPIGAWLAAIVAHRAMEPNHLWEDLGLAKRPDLTRLLLRHFPALAEKNTRNMRWKRFLYRSLCEAEGFSMCPSPTCDSCSEFNICYGDESGEAIMARNNREFNLREAESHDASDAG